MLSPFEPTHILLQSLKFRVIKHSARMKLMTVSAILVNLLAPVSENSRFGQLKSSQLLGM